MKKRYIAFFIVVMMLMLPLSTATKTADIDNITQEEDVEIPKIVVTSEEKNELKSFIEEKFEGEDKTEAYNLLNRIINTALEVDLGELSDASILYIYNPIPEEELYGVTTANELDQLLNDYWGLTPQGFIQNLFGELIIKIINFIKARLGWVYPLFDGFTSLFYGGITLFVDIIKPAVLVIAVLFVGLVNQILYAPKIVADAIVELFQQNYQEFDTILTTFATQFTGDLSALIGGVNALIYHPQLNSYLTELQEYIDWFGGEPWKDQIHITGKITTLLGEPREGLVVTCGEGSDTTDSNGQFGFHIDVTPNTDSFPQNQYYGMHYCLITVTNNGNVKAQSLKLLSYSFSGGEINWLFLVPEIRPKDTHVFSSITERINNLLTRILSFFPNVLRNINILSA